jgi:squalene-associated FAD-dependent desaturase
MSDAARGQSVLIVGGGLAGLAAATALAPLGFHITILESRDRLGGRASSFEDPSTGQLVDNCQHVSMGCCTNFAHFCRTVGIDHYLQPQRSLFFLTPDGKMSRFQADRSPAPWHLARSFCCLHYLTVAEKIRIAYGLWQLQRESENADPPFKDWLRRHGQTQRIVTHFWGLVLVSALNETPDRIGLRYARKVFVDGFLRHPRGFEVHLPVVPLGRLYGAELRQWLDRYRVQIRFQTRVRSLHVADHAVQLLQLRDGTKLQADWYISALPFARLLEVLPEEVVQDHEYFRNIRNLETSPITSVHVWFDRPVLSRPHFVLLDSVGHWVFDRGRMENGGHYVQVVVSAARQLREFDNEEIGQRIVTELRRVFPTAIAAKVLRARVVVEHAATFSAVPGVDRWRPAQTSPLDNLFVAGDWTATGWPATMESAVRSGYLAAEQLSGKSGLSVRFVQPDL